MPRIPHHILDCTAHLYQSQSDAQDGRPADASGFLVSVDEKASENLAETVPVVQLTDSQRQVAEFHCDVDPVAWGLAPEGPPSAPRVYAVTTSHVVEQGAATIRLQLLDGRLEVIPGVESGWIKHPRGDDVAICLLDFELEEIGHRAVPERLLLTKELVDQHSVGLGDECFFVGRSFLQEGRQQREPTVRFGHLAKMAGEPVYNKSRGLDQESFLVDARSHDGFSGSPAFVKIGQWRPPENPAQTDSHLVLLGVVWGHLPVVSRLEVANEPREAVDLGLACIVPAWKLMELLHSPEAREAVSTSGEPAGS